MANKSLASKGGKHAFAQTWAEALERLEEPFSEALIERTYTDDRPGVRGTRKGYDTTGVKYQAVVDRLNAVIGPHRWAAEVSEMSVVEGKTAKGRPWFGAFCCLTLTISLEDVDAVRVCYGGHESASPADARKGAFTNALKKTAALFGCGGQAYLGQLDDDAHGIGDGQRAESQRAESQRAKSQRAKSQRANSATKVDEGEGEYARAAEYLTLCVESGDEWRGIVEGVHHEMFGARPSTALSKAETIRLAKRIENIDEERSGGPPPPVES